MMYHYHDHAYEHAAAAAAAGGDDSDGDADDGRCPFLQAKRAAWFSMTGFVECSSEASPGHEHRQEAPVQPRCGGWGGVAQEGEGSHPPAPAAPPPLELGGRFGLDDADPNRLTAGQGGPALRQAGPGASLCNAINPLAWPIVGYSYVAAGMHPSLKFCCSIDVSGA